MLFTEEQKRYRKEIPILIDQNILKELKLKRKKTSLIQEDSKRNNFQQLFTDKLYVDEKNYYSLKLDFKTILMLVNAALDFRLTNW